MWQQIAQLSVWTLDVVQNSMHTIYASWCYSPPLNNPNIQIEIK